MLHRQDVKTRSLLVTAIIMLILALGISNAQAGVNGAASWAGTYSSMNDVSQTLKDRMVRHKKEQPQYNYDGYNRGYNYAAGQYMPYPVAAQNGYMMYWYPAAGSAPNAGQATQEDSQEQPKKKKAVRFTSME